MTSITIPATRGGRKKTGFFHARWNTVGLNESAAADVLGVSVDQVRQWDIEGNDFAERYLLLWDRKRPGLKSWERWYFTRGEVLVYHGPRRQALGGHDIRRFTPDGLLKMHDDALEFSRLRAEVFQLRAEIRRLRSFDPGIHIEIATSLRGYV